MAPLPTETPPPHQTALISSAFRPLSFPFTPLSPSKPSIFNHTALLEATNAADNFLKSLRAAASHFRSSLLHVRFKGANVSKSISTHNFAAILPGDNVASLVVANGVNNFLNIYNTLLVCRLVLTWFPNSPPAIVSPLSTICDPYLNIFRGVIPPLGGLDLSPILAFLVLNAFTSTAAALPAELPEATASHRLPLSSPILQNLTSTQEKWMRRFGTKNIASRP